VKILHKYTKNIKKIYIYGSSTLFANLIYFINLTLGIDVNEKIILSDDFTNIKSKLNLS
jgi:hypothetical protein